MVYDQNGRRMKRVWHPEDFEGWLAQLRDHSARTTGNPDTLFDQVYAALNEYADDSKGWIMSSYVPGTDWTDTPYQPLYECLGDAGDYAQWNCARWFFGNFLCRVLIERLDEWDAFPKADKEDGTLYKRKDVAGGS
jgi:hypothetical protein